MNKTKTNIPTLQGCLSFYCSTVLTFYGTIWETNLMLLCILLYHLNLFHHIATLFLQRSTDNL